MTDPISDIAFGPVPSRRLGISLGVNNIPPKYCSYSCVYCQVGRTDHLIVSPREFYPPQRIYESVKIKVELTCKSGRKIDYITFVSDGEPTLDKNLGEALDCLRPLGFPLAVISNGSLLPMPDVRRALEKADWVSIKLDCVTEDGWHRINRPHGKLNLDDILNGALKFAADYKGTLATETLLVDGIYDKPGMIDRLADYLAKLRPNISYIAIPTRPPAECWVKPPPETLINMVYQRIKEIVPSTELLIDASSNDFASSGDLTGELLAITAVHPIDEMSLQNTLQKAGESWSTIDHLLATHQLSRVIYNGVSFYIRSNI